MKFSKIIARKFVFPFLVGIGYEKVIRDNTLNSTLNIVYHGVVLKDSTSITPNHLTIKQFEKHLKYFSEHFDVISIPEAFDRYRKGIKNKRKTITISFDDGYKNNLVNALPLLEKYNIKATFFISSIVTQKTDFNILYSNIIESVIHFHKDELIEVEGVSFINYEVIDTKENIFEFLKHKIPADRDKILNDLMVKYDIIAKIKDLDPEIWQLLSKEDLIKLASSKIVDIGSHGHLHYNMGLISLPEAEEELRKSKLLLEEAIGKKIDMIAYPDGCYTKQVKDLAENIGYDKQLAAVYRCDDDLNDKRVLPRYGASATTTFESNVFFISKAFKTIGFN